MKTTVSAVIVGLDRSGLGQAAAHYAAELASHRHLPLRLVHAYEPITYPVVPPVGWTPELKVLARKSAQELIDHTVEELRVGHPDLKMSSLLKVGGPVKALLEQSKAADTIVLGSRGRGGFADLMVGSTTLHVAAHAVCPVIAIPHPSDPAAPRRGVVVGIDGSSASEAAIGYAFETAAETGEPLTAILAWHDPTRTGAGTMMPVTYDPAEVVKRERVVLADALSGWQQKFPDVEVEEKVVLGHPVPVLVSQSRDARLLVVGCRGRGALRSLVLGSVSHGVLHHATGPVAVVHARS
jgi:nucleotide-binding universal stress UspA family protein